MRDPLFWLHYALWIALDSALHGQFDAARTWLARADATQLEGFYQSLHALLSALAVDSQADDYAMARRLLHDAHKPVNEDPESSATPGRDRSVMPL